MWDLRTKECVQVKHQYNFPISFLIFWHLGRLYKRNFILFTIPDQAMAPLMLPFQKFDAVVNVKHQCGAALSPCLRYLNFNLSKCSLPPRIIRISIYFSLQFSRHVASLRSIRSVGQILYCRARLERASSTHPSHRLSFLKS